MCGGLNACETNLSHFQSYNRGMRMFYRHYVIITTLTYSALVQEVEDREAVRHHCWPILLRSPLGHILE